ncbi:MAG: hypothetical protein ACE5JI_04545 [Acidobacteriota bacterium]
MGGISFAGTIPHRHTRAVNQGSQVIGIPGESIDFRGDGISKLVAGDFVMEALSNFVFDLGGHVVAPSGAPNSIDIGIVGQEFRSGRFGSTVRVGLSTGLNLLVDPNADPVITYTGLGAFGIETTDSGIGIIAGRVTAGPGFGISLGASDAVGPGAGGFVTIAGGSADTVGDGGDVILVPGSGAGGGSVGITRTDGSMAVGGAALIGAERLRIAGGELRVEDEVLAADGSAGNPSFQWLTDNVTGMYRFGVSDFGFSIGGGTIGRFKDFGLHIPGTTTDPLSRLFTVGVSAFGVSCAHFEDSGDATLEIHSTAAGGRKWGIIAGSTGLYRIRDFDAGVDFVNLDDPADTETALLIRRNVGGVFTLQRVSMGAANSGGAGFKLLRVPN